MDSDKKFFAKANLFINKALIYYCFDTISLHLLAFVSVHFSLYRTTNQLIVSK